MPSMPRYLRNPVQNGRLASGHRTGIPVHQTTMTTTTMTAMTTGVGAPTGTRNTTVTTTTGAAALGEMRETTSRKTESTAAGEDAHHARSTRMKRLPTRKSSHVEHSASHVPYVRRVCQTGSN